MLVNSYTLSQLLDLALRVPEIGAVNFNILHTVLKVLIDQSGLSNVKPWCNIENPVVAQTALTTLKLKPQPLRRSVSEYFSPVDGQEYQVRRQHPEQVQRPFTADASWGRGVPAVTPETTGIEIVDEPQNEPQELESETFALSSDEEPLSATEDEPHQQQETLVPEPSEEEPLETPTLPDSSEASTSTQKPKVLSKVKAPAKLVRPPHVSAPTKRVEEYVPIIRLEEHALAKRVQEISEDGQLQMPSTSDILSGIQRGQQSQLMSEVWRATNVNRRLDGAEEGLQKLSYIVDRLVDRNTDMDAFRKTAQENMQEMQTMLSEYQAEIEHLKSRAKDVDEVKDLAETIVTTSMTKEEVRIMVNEAVEAQPEYFEVIEEKIEYCGGAITYILEETGIEYTPPVQESAPPGVEVEEEEPEEQRRKHKYDMKQKWDFAKRKIHEEMLKKEDFALVLKLMKSKEKLQESQEDELEEELDDEEEELKEPQKPVRRRPPPRKSSDSEESDDYEPSIAVSKKSSTSAFLQRFTEIWEELEDMRSKIGKLQKKVDEAEVPPAADLERNVQRISNQLNAIRTTIILTAADIKRHETMLATLQENIEYILTHMADKEIIESLVLTKADRSELEEKVDRGEYLSNLAETAEILDCVARNLTKIKENQGMINETLFTELYKRLPIADYHALQEPVLNRLHALMFGFKNMKNALLRALYPEAAGVTKCVSCSRPAELAGAKIKSSGGDAFIPKKRSDDFDSGQLNPLGPDDNQSSTGERTVISLPTIVAPKKSPIRSLPPFRQRKETDLPYFADRVPVREMADDLVSSLQTRPSTRFVGGEHTMMLPMQRGVVYSKLELPPRSRHSGIVVGQDNTVYKSSDPPDHQEEDKFLIASKEAPSRDSVNQQSQLADSQNSDYTDSNKPTLPPRDHHTPSYVGKRHTMADPTQREKQFSPFKLKDDPIRSRGLEEKEFYDGIKKKPYIPSVLSLTFDPVPSEDARKSSSFSVPTKINRASLPSSMLPYLN